MFKNLLSGVKLIFILSLFSSNEIHAQTNWSYLPNAPFVTTFNRFDDVFFVNENKGWIVALYDSIYKTQDGGSKLSIRNQVVPPFMVLKNLLLTVPINPTFSFTNSIDLHPGLFWFGNDSDCQLLPPSCSLRFNL